MSNYNYPVNPEKLKLAKEILLRKKVAVFIVAYNAEKFIEGVLLRIPEEIRHLFVEIFIIDDSSKDQTFNIAQIAKEKLALKNLSVLKTPFNRGYGGNQKIGYHHAIRKKYDVVILLHGDGQYPPEFLPDIIVEFDKENTCGVFASRMINKKDALKGNMPFYKWVGNQVLTGIENIMLKTRFSEFHTGYRAYSVSALKEIPFIYNSDDFHFDTDIIIQMIAAKKHIAEIPIPTHYGSEVCHVNGLKYFFDCIKSILVFKLMRIGLVYHRKFDINLFSGHKKYYDKSPYTLHQYITTYNFEQNLDVAYLGQGKDDIPLEIARKVKSVVIAEEKLKDLNTNFEEILGKGKYNAALMLDLVEHLNSSESAFESVFKILKPGGQLFAGAGNIGYFVTRFSLMLGFFNYGKLGILDMTHKRLFTIYSFITLLEQKGFQIEKKVYFGPPIVDMISANFLFKILDKIFYYLANLWPSMFAFHFLIIAKRLDSLDDIYSMTFKNEN